MNWSELHSKIFTKVKNAALSKFGSMIPLNHFIDRDFVNKLSLICLFLYLLAFSLLFWYFRTSCTTSYNVNANIGDGCSQVLISSNNTVFLSTSSTLTLYPTNSCPYGIIMNNYIGDVDETLNKINHFSDCVTSNPYYQFSYNYVITACNDEHFALVPNLYFGFIAVPYTNSEVYTYFVYVAQIAYFGLYTSDGSISINNYPLPSGIVFNSHVSLVNMTNDLKPLPLTLLCLLENGYVACNASGNISTTTFNGYPSNNSILRTENRISYNPRYIDVLFTSNVGLMNLSLESFKYNEYLVSTIYSAYIGVSVCLTPLSLDWTVCDMTKATGGLGNTSHYTKLPYSPYSSLYSCESKTCNSYLTSATLANSSAMLFITILIGIVSLLSFRNKNETDIKIAIVAVALSEDLIQPSSK
jgi:hypothetical protein